MREASCFLEKRSGQPLASRRTGDDDVFDLPFSSENVGYQEGLRDRVMLEYKCNALLAGYRVFVLLLRPMRSAWSIPFDRQHGGDVGDGG